MPSCQALHELLLPFRQFGLIKAHEKTMHGDTKDYKIRDALAVPTWRLVEISSICHLPWILIDFDDSQKDRSQTKETHQMLPRSARDKEKPMHKEVEQGTRTTRRYKEVQGDMVD